MQHLIIEQPSLEMTKKVWVKPEVEVIDTEYIQSGNGPKGTEGRLTVYPGSGGKYHSS
jgi:hypothetical protein